MTSGKHVVPARPLQAFVWALRQEYFLGTLLLLLGVLTVLHPREVRRYPTSVDWSTITALAGLLLVTKGIETSGYPHRFSRYLLARLGNEQALAIVLVLASAGLAMFLTNDIALFIVVPLTLTLRAQQTLPVARLIVFEALAVNAGSALTPIGNPQNLFLWQLSGVSAIAFTRTMLPLVVLLLALLLSCALLAFRPRGLAVAAGASGPVLQKGLFLTSLALYVPFFVLLNLQMPEIGLALLLLIGLDHGVGHPLLFGLAHHPLRRTARSRGYVD